MSSIRFRCPGCGKTFDLASTMAGKKARCKQCGQIMKVPVPSEPSGTTRGRQNSPKRGPEPDRYELDEPVSAADARAPRPRGSAASAPFKRGTKIDVLEVAECSTDR